VFIHKKKTLKSLYYYENMVKQKTKEETVKAVLRVLSQQYPELFRADAITQHSNALVGFLLDAIGTWEKEQEEMPTLGGPELLEG